jgi:hypothetical protein
MSIFRHITKKRAYPWFAHALANLAALYIIYRLARIFMKAADSAAHRKIHKRKAKIKI